MKNVLLIFLVIFLSSCGSLKLSAQGCKNQGVWQEETSKNNNSTDLKVTEVYYVWNTEQEVKIKDFVKRKGIDCKDIKKMWISIKSKYLVERELSLYIQK